MLCSISTSRTYDTTAWTRSTQKILHHFKYPITHAILTLPPGLYPNIVSQAMIRHHLFTIIYYIPDHYWHSSHIALTYSGLYAHVSNVYIILFYIYIIPHLDHDPTTPLHYYDNIIATDTVLFDIPLLHLIGITVIHYSRCGVPLVPSTVR